MFVLWAPLSFYICAMDYMVEEDEGGDENGKELDKMKREQKNEKTTVLGTKTTKGTKK